MVDRKRKPQKVSVFLFDASALLSINSEPAERVENFALLEFYPPTHKASAGEEGGEKMKKLGKIFASLLVSLAVLVLSASSVWADPVARNINITNSSAYVEATEDVTIVLDSFNLAEDVGWLLDVWANSGGNIVGGGGLIETDPAFALADVSTGVNSTGVLGAVDLGGTTLAENDTIVDSEVAAVASKTSFLGIETTNLAFLVGSIITGEGNSGENTAVGGLFGGDGGTIYAGPAGFAVVSEASANSSFLDVFVDMPGSTTARNLDVDGSLASAEASSEVGVGVETSNLAVAVGNIVSGVGNSGLNDASGGDGFDGGDGGYIDTEGALFGSETSTLVNSNETLFAVDLGGSTTAENIGIDSSLVGAVADSVAWVEVVNTNGAFLVGNIVSGTANSGGNTANGGEGWTGFGGNGGVILTGDALAYVLAETGANSNSTEIIGSVGGSTKASNIDVVDSEVGAEADSVAGVLVVNDNDAFGGNLVSVGANSGENVASGGDGGSVGGDGGLILTGEAVALVGSSVLMNDNYTLVAGSFGGNSTAENLMIDSSDVYAGANQDPDSGVFVGVINLNDVEVVNSVMAYANTGENEANGGESGGDGGEIYTGEALLLAEVETVVNTSETYAVGDFTGNATARNTGIVDSEAIALADSSSEVFILNDNGDMGGAEVSVAIMAGVNTGGNTANGDGNGGLVDSGDAVLVTDVGTTVNSSTTLVAGSGGGNATASNAGVSGSSVAAGASSTGSTEVVNVNSAEVETSVESVANSGDNDASGGSGSTGGVISTGAAVNETSVSTEVNTNDTTVVVEQGSASASNTGVSGSSATATAESSTSTTVTNTNNASVTNNVSTSSNTGGSTATDGGSVSTGGAGTVTTGSTSTNTNTTTLVVTH